MSEVYCIVFSEIVHVSHNVLFVYTQFMISFTEIMLTSYKSCILCLHLTCLLAIQLASHRRKMGIEPMVPKAMDRLKWYDCTEINYTGSTQK